jgi:hypothetical protein
MIRWPMCALLLGVVIQLMTTPKFPKTVHTFSSDQEFKQKYTHGLADYRIPSSSLHMDLLIRSLDQLIHV